MMFLEVGEKPGSRKISNKEQGILN